MVFATLIKQGLNYRFRGGEKGSVTALHLHRVVSEVDPLSNEICAEKFDWLLGVLDKYFNVLSLDEALGLLGKSDLPPRSIVITFDDGYADNYLNALPLLQKWRMPATFFVATKYLDGGIMFNDIIIESIRLSSHAEIDLSSLNIADRGRDFSTPINIGTNEQKRGAIGRILKVVKYLPSDERVPLAMQIADICGVEVPNSLMMTSEQVGMLHEAGMQIGGHSHSHPVLTCIDVDQAEVDVRINKETLESLINGTIDIFAYPNGKPGTDFNQEHVEILKELGYRAAMSTEFGVITSASDPYRLPRFMPWKRTWGRFMCQMWDNASHHDGSTPHGTAL